MQSKVLFSSFTILFAMLMLAGANNVSAADVHIGVGVGVGGGHSFHGNREFRTNDTVYNSWYPNDGVVYPYADPGYSDSTYVAPVYVAPAYVYDTPSVEFGSWYGGGYQNRGGSYGGGHGYSGGSRGGRSSGGGGGGHSGGHR